MGGGPIKRMKMSVNFFILQSETGERKCKQRVSKRFSVEESVTEQGNFFVALLANSQQKITNGIGDESFIFS